MSAPDGLRTNLSASAARAGNPLCFNGRMRRQADVAQLAERAPRKREPTRRPISRLGAIFCSLTGISPLSLCGQKRTITAKNYTQLR